jgi:hypothetical protein
MSTFLFVCLSQQKEGWNRQLKRKKCLPHPFVIGLVVDNAQLLVQEMLCQLSRVLKGLNDIFRMISKRKKHQFLALSPIKHENQTIPLSLHTYLLLES